MDAGSAPGCGQRPAYYRRLARHAGGGVADLGRAIVVDRRAQDHAVHGVAVGQRRVQPLQQHRSHAVAADGAVRRWRRRRGSTPVRDRMELSW